MRLFIFIPAYVLFLFVFGCSSLIRPERSPSTFYSLQYDRVSLSCEHSFDGGLRIWDFSTAAPFNRTQMAIKKDNATMVFSRDNQWVALPGIMVAENLLQDLSQSRLFPLVIKSMANIETKYELNGRINKFCLKHKDHQGRAILNAEISLNQSQKGRPTLLHKSYHFFSPLIEIKNPSQFVRAINKLAAQLSRDLQNDLCQIAN